MTQHGGSDAEFEMAQAIVLAYPGDLDTRTGGYRYDRRVACELESLGCSVERISLPASYPFPNVADLKATRESLFRVATGCTLLIDGLAFGAMPDLAHELSSRYRVIALIHHPLGYEAGLTEEESARLINSEKRALQAADHIVVTSPTTATTLVRDFGLNRQKITVAVPGTDKRAMATGSELPGIQLLNVGSLTPRKDQLTLVRALARLSVDSWRLTIAGNSKFAPQTARDLQREIARHGLERRIRLVGELAGEHLDRAYQTADIFVSSSIYEGYGMAIMEAVASGLPIVAARGGAVAHVVPGDTAILVPPSDPVAMAKALELVIHDQARRDRMRKAAQRARDDLPKWADAARTIARLAAR